MRSMAKLIIFVFLSNLIVVGVYAHCQVPCGIYNDKMYFDMLEENIDTIEKATREIMKYQKAKDKNYNQFVRWINTKDIHADYIMEIVAEYFFAQRIERPGEKDKSVYEVYNMKLELLHKITVYAMKTKQLLDMKNIKVLRDTVDKFEKLYFQKDKDN